MKTQAHASYAATAVSLPESVAPLWVLPGVVASGSSRGSSPMEKDALLGSPRPEVSSPSLSAEMANFGSRPGRGPWPVPSASVKWDGEGLEGGVRGKLFISLL